MRCERIADGGLPATTAALMRAAVPDARSVSADVAAIIAAVEREGDDAVRRLTQRFDTAGSTPPALRVSDEELYVAERQLPGEVRRALRTAIANVRSVARAGVVEDRMVSFDSHRIALREVPLSRAGVYVPGGRAPYPSTVVMGVVTALAAGVTQVAVCTPPGSDGTVAETILAACRMCGATEVLRMGGAQAIAALALGTESVAPVEVIVGPGNLYVQEAKRQLSDRVGIDSFAGPSDLLVLCDSSPPPELIALDLLAQAEHGPGTIVACVSDERSMLEALASRLAGEPETGAAARLVHVADLEAGLAVAEAFAPEHLELLGSRAEQLAPRVTRAGCLFVGASSATAFGDYLAGSNHTLPTAGTARFASALGPRHFRRSFSEVRIEQPAALAHEGAILARAEGFEQHARSMEARARHNQDR
jgi:histidinol dehydrogenase